MKKLVCALLIALFVTAAAYAETGLEEYSFDELMQIRNLLNAEIMSRPEWKEVTVPAGTWVVGQDIPEGVYCINNNTKQYVNFTVWRKEKDNYSNNGLVYNELIKGGDSFGRIELKTGWIFVSGNQLVFTPPVSLGF